MRDNGPGLSPDPQRLAFEPLFSTKGSRGTGLGLAIIKRVTEAHAGMIRVESMGAPVPHLSSFCRLSLRLSSAQTVRLTLGSHRDELRETAD